VRGMATNTEIVKQLPHLLGLDLTPVVVRGVKLDALIAHLRDSANCALRIFLQSIAHRIKLEADGDVSACWGQYVRQCCRGSQECSSS